MHIKAILEVFIPATFTGDTAFIYTDTATGKYVTGLGRGGESNIRGMLRVMNSDSWDNISRTIYYTEKEMPNRKFARFTKDFPYAGTQPEEFAMFVSQKLADDTTPVMGS